MKRYLFIGSVDYSARCLEALLEMKINLVGIMCPTREACRFNTDYVDPGNIAGKHKRSVYYFKRISDFLCTKPYQKVNLYRLEPRLALSLTVFAISRIISIGR